MQYNGAWEAAVVVASDCQVKKIFVKTNSKSELQRVSSCVGFFTWKRQARSQIFIKGEKAPDWSQTCFPPSQPPSYSEMHGLIQSLDLPTLGHTGFRQGAHTKLLLHSLQVCFGFPLLIAGNDPHHGTAPVIPEPLLLKAGWTMTTPQSPTEQGLFSTSLLLLQVAEKS